jgi:response regulator RpfG family c-di-GMP phosphodiesterase
LKEKLDERVNIKEKHTLSKPVILCVDDEHIILKSLKTELRRTLGGEYKIEIANSGEDALELIEELLENGIEIPYIHHTIVPNLGIKSFIASSK